MKKLFTLLIFIVCIPLTGCVSMRGPRLSGVQTNFKVQSRQAIKKQLQALSNWQADGAFSFDSQGQVGMANFRIDVSPYTWRVQISSSLNLVQMTMGSDALGVWYTDQHGHIQHAQSLDAVMRAQFGFALPVQTLISWMKGLATSDQAVIQLNEYNQLMTLKENGWVLNYSHYGLYHGVSLPGTIMMVGHDEKIKMVIRSWA